MEGEASTSAESWGAGAREFRSADERGVIAGLPTWAQADGCSVPIEMRAAVRTSRGAGADLRTGATALLILVGVPPRAQEQA